MKLRPLARTFLCTRLGSGTSTLFWHDDWTGLGPLVELTGQIGPQVSGISRTASVAQAVLNSEWVLPRGMHPSSGVIIQKMCGFPFSLTLLAVLLLSLETS